jgi:hypothetical protein
VQIPISAGRGDEEWLDSGRSDGPGPGVSTIWVAAPSMQELLDLVARSLADYAAQDIVSVSHAVVQAGWEPRRHALGGDTPTRTSSAPR